MRLLSMNEWYDVCKQHHPILIMEKPAAIGYWKSSNSEHFWRLIPASWGFNQESIDSGGKLIKQNGHQMMETTLFEEMSRR